MITPEQQAKLKEQGYYVEDMGAEWGKEYAGNYRWINDSHEELDGDGFGNGQFSEEAAWEDALAYQAQWEIDQAEEQ